MNSLISVRLPSLRDDSAVHVEFDLSRDLRRYFTARQFTTAYDDVDLRDVNPGILLIPLLANIMPVAWALDARVHVPVCDRTFYEALPRVRAAFQLLYPKLPLGGELRVDELTDSPSRTHGGAGLLFSGGVDSTASALWHKAEQLHLFTVVIDHGHGAAPGDIRPVAELLGMQHHTVDAPILEGLLDRYQLSAAFKSHFIDWWSGFQHGLALTGVCAPATHALGLDPLYLASSDLSEGEAWGSHPTVDDQVAWSGTHVVHDLEPGRRPQKIETIARFIQENGHSVTLAVCEERTNCGVCEKCARTMTALLLRGVRPDRAGFPWNPGETPEALRRVTSSDRTIRAPVATDWIELQHSVVGSTPLQEPGVADYLEHVRTLPIHQMVRRYERRAHIFRLLNRGTRFIPRPIHNRLRVVGRWLLRRWL